MRRSLVLLASVLVIAPGLAFAQMPGMGNMYMGDNTVGWGNPCPGVCGTWPRKVYDAASREWITIDFNRITGGYVKGVEQDTGKTWKADISVSGKMTGKDLDGSKWSYDPRTKLYYNQSTGRTCARTDVRHVCA